MPKKLPFTDEKWTGRLVKEDMDLIRSVHPNVNEFMRGLTGAYADRLRAKLQSGQPQSES